jgi:hypothetical protein
MASAGDDARVCGPDGQQAPCGEGRGQDAPALTRQTAFRRAGLLAAAAALAQVPAVLRQGTWATAALAAEPDLVHDTLNGLVAFVVPGPDPYSAHQGVRTAEPGGIEAGTTGPLIATLDRLQPGPPPFSAVAAATLNQVAQAVDPGAGASGPFQSPFACLSFAGKVSVFEHLETGAPDLRPLGGALLTLTGFLAYSEAGVFDPARRTPRGTPVGWTISGYAGVADGRDELKGYFQDRRGATG